MNNHIILSIVVAIAWLILIRMEVMEKPKIKYKYDDELKIMTTHIVIIIMLFILAMLI